MVKFSPRGPGWSPGSEDLWNDIVYLSSTLWEGLAQLDV